ncbi:MAG: penicillin-binding protein 1A [Granulosicoccus sp.]|nr:penicillin-binding protein 1A [Granulosicoccus sp.]
MPRKRSFFRSLFKWTFIAGIIGVIAAVAVVGVLYYKISPDLPDVERLREVQLQIPLRVYTAEGDLIAEYGEQRREPVSINEVPQSLKDSIVAAEDQHFYSHPGVAWQGLLRAFIHLVKTGEKGPGGSTITMQVARNFFLSNEKTYSRKINEIFLSLRIERELTKDQILELYINKIYLGYRSYGFAAASKVYYGKEISDINLAESAMLAGLPKAPSRFNPIINPERALLRRNYVLGRLLALDMITRSQYLDILDQPATAALHFSKPEAEANYVGEMARARVKQMFGDSWSTAGYSVYTSLRSDAQRAANKALRQALFDYEKRHGYKGPVGRLESAVYEDPVALAQALDEYRTFGEMEVAVVVAMSEAEATVRTEDTREYTFTLEDVEWARERITIDKRGDEIESIDQVLQTGDVIHVTVNDEGVAQFVQEPKVEGAFVAVTPYTGEITALVGGFDFNRSKFNRVTQARRQPGSTFKPFIYSAALEKGNTAATIYNDAPVVFHDDALEGEWRPTNYSGRFFGPTRLREALVKSRNLVSVRVLREIGIPYAIEYAQRFGFEEKNLPPDLSLALGSASTTPLEIASAFAVFANDGYRVAPHVITRIVDPRGVEVYKSPTIVLCDDCDPQLKSPLLAEVNAFSASGSDEPTGAPQFETDNAPRVIDERNAYIMQSIMREVVVRGTARRAGEALKRKDLGGKTGTTNNQLDAWFTGFNREYVAAAWIGSDGLDPLGRGEAGGKAALPMWVSFMSDVLQEVPQSLPEEPEGISTVRIARKTGEIAVSDEGVMDEIFRDEYSPAGEKVAATGSASDNKEIKEEIVKQQKKKQEIREKKKKVEQLF